MNGRWSDLSLRHLGVSPSWYPPPGVTSGRYPPLAGRMLHLGTCFGTELTCGGPLCGELSGGKWTGGRLRERAPGIDPAQRCLALRSDNATLPGFSAWLPTAPARGAR